MVNFAPSSSSGERRNDTSVFSPSTSSNNNKSSSTSSTSPSSMAVPSVLLLLLLHAFYILPSCGGRLFIGSMPLNFTVSHFRAIDNGGVFLSSPNSTFHAAMHNPGKQQSRYYFCVLHGSSHTIIWSANADSPVSSTGQLTLSASGLSLTVNDSSSTSVWSTPKLPSSVNSLSLFDNGNLVLMDGSNKSLWQSFDHPTDTVVSGQQIPVGDFLTSSRSDKDLSRGDYKMVVTNGDLVLRWIGDQQYWALKNDVRSIRNSNGPVSYMQINDSGLYLFSGNEGSRTVVDSMSFPYSAGFRMGKVDPKGNFVITSYATAKTETSMNDKFTAPEAKCDLPFSCGTLRLCRDRSASDSPCGGCPSQFKHSEDGCVPAGGDDLVSSSSCVNSGSSSVDFLGLGKKVGYFANKFATPTLSDIDFDGCRSSCSGNCSCLGFYHKNSSNSCYFLRYKLGTVFSRDNADDITYIKTISKQTGPGNSSSHKPKLLPILLPSLALVLLIVVLFLFFGKWRAQKRRGTKRMHSILKNIRPRNKSVENDNDDEDISIPGLPTRFSYHELEEATEGFNVKIGSGGFGEVFKGFLPDKSGVAVKRIGSLGVQGRREFCTEIAVIGKIHHINLVKLRGFCAQGSRRLLVYEFMNRGSLDRSLFCTSGRPVLEWQERVDIAVGSARGLAYLHNGCENRIIHCDIKPENILLHDHNGVKISDFGLAKLLTPEQSNQFTTMRGTRGYLAPEWLTNSSISDRTDVYSFGMVLLEIVRGRKNSVGSIPMVAMGSSSWTESKTTLPTATTEESYFPLVALEKHEEGRYEELADPRLEGRVTSEEVAKIVKIALCCLHEQPRRRPSMDAVLGMLEGTIRVWEPIVDLLNFLRFYGREVALPAGAMLSGGLQVGRGVNATAITSSTTTSGSVASPSYLSSEQLSGPR